MSDQDKVWALKAVVTGLEIDLQEARLWVGEWIAYAGKLEAVIELIGGQTKDQLVKMHAEQGLRLIRPLTKSS